MDIQGLIESRMQEDTARKNALAERWSRYINPMAACVKEKSGKTLSDFDKGNVAQCLENAFMEGGMKGRSRLFETTDQSNIAFLGVN